jgi:hypothetical protein
MSAVLNFLGIVLLGISLTVGVIAIIRAVLK